MIWQRLIAQLMRPHMLSALLIINFLGSIYGFYWYRNQLLSVGSWLNIFVPDSPTASAAFTIVLALLLIKRHNPLLEVFAAVTLVKYGVWAVAMIVAGAVQSVNVQGGQITDYLIWSDWMLMFSHTGMAVQAILFGAFYTYRWQHLMIVAAWTILNDVVDYTLDLHPWLPASIADYDHVVGWFTFGLSLVCIAIASRFVEKPRPLS